MTNKDLAIAAIKDLPRSTSMAEIQYHLYVVEKITKAKADLQANGPMDLATARKIAARWK